VVDVETNKRMNINLSAAISEIQGFHGRTQPETEALLQDEQDNLFTG
jgi:hypothetical protein